MEGVAVFVPLILEKAHGIYKLSWGFERKYKIFLYMPIDLDPLPGACLSSGSPD
jgi:hypothetical protein